eukprot:2093179-Alexandrium_andersonii.AAC.1
MHVGVLNIRTGSTHGRVTFKQLQLSGVACSSNFGTCRMASGVRSLICTGPGTCLLYTSPSPRD